jgi:hypothetical protein
VVSHGEVECAPETKGIDVLAFTFRVKPYTIIPFSFGLYRDRERDMAGKYLWISSVLLPPH